MAKRPGRKEFRLTALALAPVLASALAPGSMAQDEDTLVQAELVHGVFAAYKDALIRGDGDAAVALVDSETLRYYDVLRSLALHGSEEEVRGRSFIERLLIISMRHQLTPETMERLSLADLIRTAVEEGWISAQSIEQLEIGNVRIEGNRASGEARTRSAGEGTGGNPLDTLHYEFIREDGAWKFRFSSLVSSLDRVVSEFAAQLGLPEDDLIFTLVESFSGRQVLPEVWERPE